MTPNPNPGPELKPCPNPWCHSHRGGPVVRPYVHGYTGGYCRVRCPVCPQIGPDGKTPDEAATAWNTRALSPQTVPAPGEVEEARRKVLIRIMVAHNRLNRSETTAQEFEEYALGLLSDHASEAV